MRIISPATLCATTAASSSEPSLEATIAFLDVGKIFFVHAYRRSITRRCHSDSSSAHTSCGSCCHAHFHYSAKPLSLGGSLYRHQSGAPVIPKVDNSDARSGRSPIPTPQVRDSDQSVGAEASDSLKLHNVPDIYIILFCIPRREL